MTEIKAVLMGILPLILGSSVLVASFTDLANELFNKPNIDIQAIPMANDKDSIQIRNTGRVPAKDVILIIKTPESYTLVDRFISENISRFNVTSGLLEMYISRFVPGVGAIVILTFGPEYEVYVNYVNNSSPFAELKDLAPGDVIKSIANQRVNNEDNLKKILLSNLGKSINISWSHANETKTGSVTLPASSVPQNTDVLGITTIGSWTQNPLRQYTVYATYDRGSIMENLSPYPSIQELLSKFPDIYFQLVFWVGLFGLSIFTFTAPNIHKKIFGKSGDEKEFLSNVSKDLLEIRTNLITDPSDKQIIPDNIWSLTLDDKKHQFLDNIEDFILIDDFYTKLMLRNSEIEKKQADYHAGYINKQCIYLAENALKNIDWKKYGVKVGIEYKITPKKPILAALLAFSLGFLGMPGIGHIYVGRWKRGVRIMIIGYFLLFITLYFLTSGFTNLQLGSSYITLIFLPSSIVFFIFWIWQILDANNLAKHYNEYVSKKGRRPC